MTIEKSAASCAVVLRRGIQPRQPVIVDQLFALEFKLYVPPSLGEGPQVEGAEGFKQLVVGLRAAFAGLHFDVHEIAVNTALAMVSWTMTGTHSGEWVNVPPTGRRVHFTGVDVFKFANGKMVEARIHGDYLGFLRAGSGFS